jgi:hypothetical protein
MDHHQASIYKKKLINAGACGICVCVCVCVCVYVCILILFKILRLPTNKKIFGNAFIVLTS